jgi:hypothetical protein
MSGTKLHPRVCSLKTQKKRRQYVNSLQQTSLKVIWCESITEDVYSKYDPLGICCTTLKIFPSKSDRAQK